MPYVGGQVFFLVRNLHRVKHTQSYSTIYMDTRTRSSRAAATSAPATWQRVSLALSGVVEPQGSPSLAQIHPTQCAVITSLFVLFADVKASERSEN